MNILLTISLLLLVGYYAGLLLNKIGLPKIIGYLATGIAFTPNTSTLLNYEVIEINLAFYLFTKSLLLTL